MPSPGKVPIVPPVHEVLRFSSLPCSLEPLANAMDVDNIAKLSEESERVRNPCGSSCASPPQKETDSSLSCKTPVVEDNSIPPVSQLPSVVPGLEVILSNVPPSGLSLSLDVRPLSVLAEPTFTFV
jgi:hypothetical protein